jgi:hypothetical protein
MDGFIARQLVRVTDTRSLAYGRIALVMGGGQPTQAKLRFVDLPRMVEQTDDPHTGVMVIETFNNDQLEAVEGIPIAPFYALIEMNVVDGGRESIEYLLAHGDSAAAIETIFQNVVRTWYDDDAQWDDKMEGYWVEGGLLVSAVALKLISLARYIALNDVLSDCTPT